jgi:hypothetical protein
MSEGMIRFMQRTVDDLWGVPFPKDLHAFHAFAKKNAAALEALDLRIAGPLEYLQTGKSPEESRYYNDPPEFVTVLGGMIDGLHWGYWFDAPGELEPVVVSYYANDAFELGEHGPSLFGAVSQHLEALARDAKDNLTDDPEYADDYRQQLVTLAGIRTKLKKHLVKTKSKRKVVASTRNKLGIVTAKVHYRPLAKVDAFERWNYEPKKTEVKRLVDAAVHALMEGLPGPALKLGHDLWIYPEFRRQSADMLDRAYAALGREVLREQLRKAIAWREECDKRA